ncbi:MAG TPA: PEGA domain-containing protein [Polyangiaceae bacterium]|nr:PEGA domain-containing protein [Polyangiaceae bacterium]
MTAPHRFIRWSLPLALLCATLYCPPAQAAPSTQDLVKGRELKQQGDEALTTFRFDDALQLYEQAWELTQNPALYYNRARAYEGLTRYPQALEQLLLFQDQAPADLKRKVPQLDEFVARLRSKVSQLTLTVNITGAQVLINHTEAGTTPFSAPLKLNAGTVLLEITAQGYEPFKREVELPGGGELAIDAQLKHQVQLGLLTVTSPVTGAMVYVDGKRVGMVPAQTQLQPGQHSVRVMKEGYDEALTNTVLAEGDQKKLQIQLDQHSSILGKWWFWTAAGVVVAGGVAVTIAATTERSADSGSIAPGTVSAPLISY